MTRGKNQLQQHLGFTLLEVLVAGSILFLVTTAIVGLSNAIVRGTSVNADKTVANRWASEGLEVIEKLRNDSVKSGGTAVVTGENIWFGPALDSTKYGWYKLSANTVGGATTWTLDPTSAPIHLDFSQAADFGLPVTSQDFTATRLICVEAYGAVDSSSDANSANCNASDAAGGSSFNDGDRAPSGDCALQDTYCLATKASLNVNHNNATSYIPAGNMVKVRSVVIWPDHNQYKSTELSTLLGNWKDGTQL